MPTHIGTKDYVNSVTKSRSILDEEWDSQGLARVVCHMLHVKTNLPTSWCMQYTKASTAHGSGLGL